MSRGGSSLSEFVIFWYVSRFFSDARYRERVDGFELDVYVPSILTAVDFDGRHWHDGRIDSENRKDAFCVGNGIRLIRVRDRLLGKTNSAEIVWHDETSCYDEGSAVAEVLSLLGMNSVDVDIARDSSEIQNAYAQATFDETAGIASAVRDYVGFARSIILDGSPNLMRGMRLGVGECDVRGVHLRALDGWSSRLDIVSFGEWFVSFFQDDVSGLDGLSGSFVEYSPYRSVAMYFGGIGSIVVFGFDRVSEDVTFMSLMMSRLVIDKTDAHGGRVEICPLMLAFDRDAGSLGEVFNRNLSVFSAVDKEWQALALLCCYAVAYLTGRPAANDLIVDRRCRKVRRCDGRRLRRGESTVHAVHDVVSREYVTRSGSDARHDGGTGRHVRRHVRRGHWHRYWCGSGDARHVEYRFVAEIMVNDSSGGDVATSVVSVREDTV